MITLNNIAKTYYQGKLAVPILHGISLTIQAGSSFRLWDRLVLVSQRL